MFKVNDVVTLSPESRWHKQCIDRNDNPMTGMIMFLHASPEYKYSIKFSNGTRFSYRDIDLIYPKPLEKHNKKKLNLNKTTFT